MLADVLALVDALVLADVLALVEALVLADVLALVDALVLAEVLAPVSYTHLKNVSVKHGCVLLCMGIFIVIFLSATAPAMLIITLYAVKMINEV